MSHQNSSQPTCSMCGLCCRLFVINLSEAEYCSGKYQTVFDGLAEFSDFVAAKSCGANLLEQRQDGSCIYLVDNKCSIHKNRPEVCGKFFCQGEEPEYRGMRKIIKEARRA